MTQPNPCFQEIYSGPDTFEKVDVTGRHAREGELELVSRPFWSEKSLVATKGTEERKGACIY